MPATRPVDPLAARWTMLSILSLGFFSLTLNWFDIGFVLIFGFAAWSSVPGRVAGVAHERLGTAIGLMLTIAAVGGFLVPVGFGAVVERVGFPAGWAFLAAVSLAFALIGFAGRDTARSEPRHGATRASEDLRRADR